MLSDEEKKNMIKNIEKSVERKQFKDVHSQSEQHKDCLYERFEKAQKEVRKLKIDRYLKKGDDPKYVFTYLSLQKIKDVLEPVLSKNKLTYTQSTHIEDGLAILQTKVFSIDTGEIVETCELPLFDVKSTGMTWRDKGSAITYARRYELCSIFNICAEHDDDGKAEAIKADIGGCQSMVALTNLYNSLLPNDQKQFKNEFAKRKEELTPVKKTNKNEDFNDLANVEIS